MSEQIRQIAQRIKELREIAGYSIEELANYFNISKELYEQYESGNVDIPVSFLYGIANKYNVELSAILTGDGPRLHTYSIVKKDKGVSVERRKQYKYQSLGYNFAHKKFEPFLVVVDPLPEDAPFSLNSHTGQEFNYILEGSIKIIINNHEIILNEGDSLYFDSKYEHGMKALNDKPAKFLAIIF